MWESDIDSLSFGLCMGSVCMCLNSFVIRIEFLIDFFQSMWARSAIFVGAVCHICGRGLIASCNLTFFEELFCKMYAY